MPLLRTLPGALCLLLAAGVPAADPEPAPPGEARAAPPAKASFGGEVSTDPAVQEVWECMKRNIPPRSSAQTVEFTAVDRIGGEKASRAKIWGKRLEDGMRRLKLKFLAPPYLRSSELLLIETDGSPDAFLYTPELRRPKRITGSGGGGTLFGTDFSYEDFERWQLFNRPGLTERRPDATVEEQPVYVLWTRPADEANSQYEKIETYVHRETCVVLKSDSYEPGNRLRRVLSADPKSLLEEGGIWIATELVMRDVRDETHTRVVVEEIEVDQEVHDNVFAVGRMGRRGD